MARRKTLSDHGITNPGAALTALAMMNNPISDRAKSRAASPARSRKCAGLIFEESLLFPN